MKKIITAAVATIAAVVVSGSVEAQISCGSYPFAEPYAAAFLAGKPFDAAAQAAQTIHTMADGVCHQDRVVALLEEELGSVVGYKAAATSAGAQKQLGLDGPVLGVLLQGMMRENGSTVVIKDGARMIFELDLLARVGSAAINEATTREEALAGLDAVVPFIELGDLMVPKGAAITGPLLQAMNAGARLGVVGNPIPIDGLDADALAGASGVLTMNGTVVAQAPATALLGHPLDAVLWIVKAANARGMTLKEGDVLSLGSLGRFQLAAPGTITATYTGFSTEPATVSVTLD
ncbi:2-keto-4-pentenoate hydratase [Acuticoccus mangrovi]|uniref:Hydratase n=1 Tax=Acuticoccus mangrovi TaxID=2796142 RepID=A0A934MIZ2_9HYPH|nr:hydratase [Acuticoccus mangrovi]MBJ3777716.1 hydratase [Acuticoccus mangrovi]